LGDQNIVRSRVDPWTWAVPGLLLFFVLGKDLLHRFWTDIFVSFHRLCSDVSASKKLIFKFSGSKIDGPYVLRDKFAKLDSKRSDGFLAGMEQHGSSELQTSRVVSDCAGL